MNLLFIVSSFSAGIITVLTSVGIIAYYNISFAVFAIVISIMVLILPLVFQKKLEEKNEDTLSKKDDVVENMKNIFANIEYIRLEQQKSIVENILKPVQSKYSESLISYEKLKSVLAHLINGVLLCVEILVYAVGCYMISLGNIDIAVFVKVVLMISVTKNGVNWLMEGIQSIHDIKNSQKRIKKIMLKGTEDSGKALDGIHNLKLENLSFKYEENNTKITYPYLVLEEKNIYHLVGKNGIGKSTLLKVLGKYYSGYEGSILVNKSQELKDVNEKDWYRLVAYIPQKPLLFHMSIKDNILLGLRDVDWELYEKLMNEFGLKKIEDKMVGFGGEGVSGGEAQSISIVRVLLRKPQMILADEPYNTLDIHRKNTLNNYIDMMKSTTFVIVSHQKFQIERTIMEVHMQ